MGHLISLWCVALEQQEDGDLSSWSDEFIAESSDYPGDAPQFVRLLQQHGFLHGKLIHDWLDYAGDLLINRYASYRRERLVEIWSKHGRVYGERKVCERKLNASRAKPARNQIATTTGEESSAAKQQQHPPNDSAPPRHPETASPPGPAAGGCAESAAGSLREELQKAGIGEPSLSQCLKVPGLWPVLVRIEADRARREAKPRADRPANPVGLLVTRLKAFKPSPAVPLKEVSRLAQAGQVAAICGRRLHPEGKVLVYDGPHAEHCITFVDDQEQPVKLSAKDLKPELIELVYHSEKKP